MTIKDMYQLALIIERETELKQWWVEFTSHSARFPHNTVAEPISTVLQSPFFCLCNEILQHVALTRVQQKHPLIFYSHKLV